MSKQKVIAIALYAIIRMYKKRKEERNKKRKRRWYVRPLNRNKRVQCYYQNYFKKMMDADGEQFRIHTRMPKELYSMLLMMIKPSITKDRQRINADERLSITLLYLAHGTSMQSIAWTYQIGKSTVRLIILETCEAIWSNLSPLYLSTPTQSQYKNIAEDFNTMWNFPNCVGAIDGKHIALKCPNKSGSLYFNYKKYFSIVLMAICDARYTFTAVSVGSYGSESDGGIFQVSPFGQAILSDKLPLPPNTALSQSGERLPHVFVGDAAFPLGMRLMRPFAPTRCGKSMDEKRRIFNYRLSRARRTIENAFGVLTVKWRVLRTTMELTPENAERVVLACVALHNFVMMHDMDRYCPVSYVDSLSPERTDIPGEWRTEALGFGNDLRSISATHVRRSALRPRELRDVFANYFVNEGAVSFQTPNL